MTALSENDEHRHQRPESDWKQEFDKKFFTRLLGRNIETSEMKAYIARIAKAEYQRGLAEGAREERQAIVTLIDNIENNSFSNSTMEEWKMFKHIRNAIRDREVKQPEV